MLTIWSNSDKKVPSELAALLTAFLLALLVVVSACGGKSEHDTDGVAPKDEELTDAEVLESRSAAYQSYAAVLNPNRWSDAGEQLLLTTFGSDFVSSFIEPLSVLKKASLKLVVPAAADSYLAAELLVKEVLTLIPSIQYLQMSHALNAAYSCIASPFVTDPPSLGSPVWVIWEQIGDAATDANEPFPLHSAELVVRYLEAAKSPQNCPNMAGVQEPARKTADDLFGSAAKFLQGEIEVAKVGATVRDELQVQTPVSASSQEQRVVIEDATPTPTPTPVRVPTPTPTQIPSLATPIPTNVPQSEVAPEVRFYVEPQEVLPGSTVELVLSVKAGMPVGTFNVDMDFPQFGPAKYQIGEPVTEGFMSGGRLHASAIWYFRNEGANGQSRGAVRIPLHISDGAPPGLYEVELFGISLWEGGNNTGRRADWRPDVAPLKATFAVIQVSN